MTGGKVMEIKAIDKTNRTQVNSFIKEHWYTTEMVVGGRIVDMSVLEGFVLYNDKNIEGLITYEIIGHSCEIMSLDSVVEKRGYGSMLLEKVVNKAGEKHCNCVHLITTNDNLNALGFYQKRGFDMVEIYRNAVTEARKIKPSIPLIGDFGIPLKHEIELEMNIS